MYHRIEPEVASEVDDISWARSTSAASLRVDTGWIKRRFRYLSVFLSFIIVWNCSSWRLNPGFGLKFMDMLNESEMT